MFTMMEAREAIAGKLGSSTTMAIPATVVLLMAVQDSIRFQLLLDNGLLRHGQMSQLA